MIKCKVDTRYNFKSYFNTVTGKYIRTGILENGHDSNKDPFMSSFPELIDIGIMGHCKHGLSGKCKQTGVQCYQHGDISTSPNMTFDDYKKVIEQCKNKVFQVALGGCGDPDQHEDFENILKLTTSLGIVPNYTTSGFGLNDELAKISKKYCGAVAVSWYDSPYTYKAINLLLSRHVVTNVHFVISNSTIDKAIDMIENDKFPVGINAVIFLLHKPVGLGAVDNMLRASDERVKKFFHLIDTKRTRYKIGFDSCCVPAILNYTTSLNLKSIDTCEAARWSMYISSDLVAMPCSFDNQAQRYAVDLKDGTTIQQAWYSDKFEEIRNKFRTTCVDCPKHEMCLSGCPLIGDLALCNLKKTYAKIN